MEYFLRGTNLYELTLFHPSFLQVIYSEKAYKVHGNHFLRGIIVIEYHALSNSIQLVIEIDMENITHQAVLNIRVLMK